MARISRTERVDSNAFFSWYTTRPTAYGAVAVLPIKDVAEAAGWRDTTTLLRCYQQSDPETLEAVVNNGNDANAA